MKAKSARDWPGAAPVWAGWLAILYIGLVESWLLWRFGSNCLQTIAQQDWRAAVPDVFLAFR